MRSFKLSENQGIIPFAKFPKSIVITGEIALSTFPKMTREPQLIEKRRKNSNTTYCLAAKK